MAKKRKSGVGSVITIRRMRGLGNLKQPSSFAGAALPPLLGAALAGLTILGARYFAKPSEGPTPTAIFKFAPAIGFGVGALGSLALYWLGGAPAALSAGTAAAAVSGLAFATDMHLKSSPGEYALAVGGAAGAASVDGLGVIVPERLGTRGIMMESAASRDPVNRYGVGSYGETVQLRGISPSAFGRTHLGR
jgi:hypothetical protein